MYHRHQKALSNSKVTFNLLNLPKINTTNASSFAVVAWPRKFGYEKAHYDVKYENTEGMEIISL